MSHGARILVVDDEPQIRRSLQVNLEGKGYAVFTADGADQAFQAISNKPPDVILVDLLMPQIDGIELTRRIRQQSGVPIIVVSAIGDERKKVEALEVGADDYVTKPFNMEELLARIKSVLRRAAGAHSSEPIWTSGDLSVNFDRREVRLNGESVKLTPTEYDLLKYMIENAGKVLTQKMLLTAVWGPAYGDQAQYLRVFVGQLRKKLEKNPASPRFILTDLGVGYRFCADAS
jgi:two-component system, OmpR family, KDP operon response regulator KdpE